MRLRTLAIALLALMLAACSFGAGAPAVDVAGADGAMDGTTLDIGTAGSIDPID